ncbi:MAG: VWA domain-containing protein, partial [Planctomycetaceae bacterium]|nr:VWA domain-containing protein [Planctomycetaceae bacterium]
VQSGGMVTTAIGAAAAQPVAQTKIEQSEALKDPEIKVTTISDISIPGVGELGVDLGEGEVSGETGARVEGYGAAMGRLTQEIIRMMRKQPVLCVWLFDASNSLKDDREEISRNFNKIYEELKIAEKDAASRNQRFSPLETMVCQFGKDIKELLPKPTNDIPAIQKAILDIKEDESGVENTFGAISKMMDKYAAGATRNDRKLCIIVLTDETGEDDGVIEELIVKSDKFKVPLYFMGREAIFGYPYAHVRWIDPEPPNLHHWIRVDRGPETAFPECLQYDGFHGRWDSASSGFGPYAQVRIAKKSGGIYFMLSTEEKDLIGSDARGQRKFDDLAMKEYEPLLLARREYEQSRAQSEFRTKIWQVIVELNPHLDGQLNLQRLHYPMAQEDFIATGKRQFERAVRALGKMNQAIEILKRIEPLRAKEREPRWRAAYDLCFAQLLSYRVRQFQLLLAIDKHVKENPKPTDPKHNEWNVHNVPRMLEPDAEQIKATKIDLEELNSQQAEAIKRYDVVIAEHPGTPWARRANAEKGWGFGIEFRSNFWDPKYNDPAYQARVPKF